MSNNEKTFYGVLAIIGAYLIYKNRSKIFPQKRMMPVSEQQVLVPPPQQYVEPNSIQSTQPPMYQNRGLYPQPQRQAYPLYRPRSVEDIYYNKPQNLVMVSGLEKVRRFPG